MLDVSLLLAGFADVFTLSNMLFILCGVALGQIVGAIPGLSIIMALAIAVPLTYGLDTLAAISFLISVNKGGTIGGAVPAILLNVPGSAESAATTMDGHPMAKNGKPMKAMKYALYHSVSGDLASDIVLILLAAPLAIMALKIRPIAVDPAPLNQATEVLVIRPKKGWTMKRRFSDEQIIGMIKEYEAGVKAQELCRKYGISDATFYEYKARFGGMNVSDAKKLRALEDENNRLKRMLADAMLDNAALKDLATKNY